MDLNIGRFIFTRLAIIDLNDRSSQPMLSNNENIYLMNNGEIYNYLEIKKKFQVYEIVSQKRKINKN